MVSRVLKHLDARMNELGEELGEGMQTLFHAVKGRVGLSCSCHMGMGMNNMGMWINNMGMTNMGMGHGMGMHNMGMNNMGMNNMGMGNNMGRMRV